jgi:hypothetical protein
MSTAELKLKLFREIDLLEKSKLEQLYASLIKIMNTEINDNSWDSLSKNQQKGILDAIDEMNDTGGIEHQLIIEKYLTKYA